ncbi:TPA: ABC transporter ATP-binding protein [Candidatus Poribacteria bacterium]|nr:ABC transporter ATP-binding protein [Candidatus Poribacteria bacterium]HIO49432.1 ABC transporter ATP-binding protein [Candidatus Poribacteria bacterium]
MVLVQIENLSVFYGKSRALNNINLSIDSKSTGLLGPNGAGKSTLIKTLLGFLIPSSGSVRIFDLPVHKNPIKIRQQIGYMPENDCYIPDMNGLNFIVYMGELAGMPKADAIQRAHEVLQYVNLGEARYRKVETYSIGMKQRVKLAQALIHDPMVLLLDEPTNGMDPIGRQEMLELIREISTYKEIDVILSSHILDDVEYVCKDVIALDQGQVVLEGNMKQLKLEHRLSYELKIKGNQRAFIFALRENNCEVEVRSGVEIRVTSQDTIPISQNLFFQLAVETDVQIRHLGLVERSLEDIFVSVVR